MSGDSIGLRYRSKSVEGSLFAIVVVFLGGKSISLYFLWRVGDDFHKKSQIFLKKILH